MPLCLFTANTAAGNGAAEDIFAAMVAAVAGIAVLLYAASSDLFDLKLFKFDPKAARLPKQARVEYWYARAARRLWSWLSVKPPRQARVDYWYARAAKRLYASLTDGGWSYAKAKKRSKVRVRRDWRRMRGETRRLLPDAVRRLNRDIALGVMAIAVTLVALLVLRLL